MSRCASEFYFIEDDVPDARDGGLGWEDAEYGDYTTRQTLSNSPPVHGPLGAWPRETAPREAPCEVQPGGAEGEAHGPEEGLAFLFVDVDGYCTGGIDQRTIVSPEADGYRARELGWAYFTRTAHEGGSIYFRDVEVAPIAVGDPGVAYASRMVGLPVAPTPDLYAGEAVMCSSRLLEAFWVLHETVAGITGLPVVFVHKGGNEGVWIARAVPGAAVVDIGALGCPKVDEIGRACPELHEGKHCGHHAPTRRRTGRIVHCPRLEVLLLASWIAQCVVVAGSPGPEPEADT